MKKENNDSENRVKIPKLFEGKRDPLEIKRRRDELKKRNDYWIGNGLSARKNPSIDNNYYSDHNMSACNYDADEDEWIKDFSCLYPNRGLLLYFLWKEEKPKSAKAALKSAIFGSAIVLIPFFILCLIAFFAGAN